MIDNELEDIGDFKIAKKSKEKKEEKKKEEKKKESRPEKNAKKMTKPNKYDYKALGIESPDTFDYEHHNLDWCRYCGARYSSNFTKGPWGPRTLCTIHYIDWN